MDSTYNYSINKKSARGGIYIKHVSAKIISTRTTHNFRLVRINLLRHTKKYLRCIKHLLLAIHEKQLRFKYSQLKI